MVRPSSPPSPASSPLPLLAVGVLAGVLASPLCATGRPALLLAVVALLGLSLAARRTAPLATLAAGLCLGLGFAARLEPALAALPARVRGVVDGSPAGREAVVAVDAVAEPGGGWSPAHGRLLVRFPELAPREGSAVVVGGNPRPLAEHGLPGAPAERWSTARAHVLGRLVATDAVVAGPDPAPSPAARLVHAGLVAAMAGRPGAVVPEDERGLLTRTGTWHLVAVSGVQVGLVAGVGWLALKWLARPLVLLWGRGGLLWPAAIGASAAAFGFAHAAGSPPSAVRAAFMAAAVAFARALGFGVGAWEGLAFALCGTLLLDPASVDHLGFQLSFSAIAGVILWSSRVTRWLPLDSPRPVRWLAGMLGATLGATLGTLPVVAWHFQSLSPLAAVTNLLVGPLLGAVATPAAVAGFGVGGAAPGLADLLLTGADTASDLALRVLAPLDVAPWHPAVGAVGAALLAVAACLPRRPVVVAAIYALVLGLRWPVPPEDGRLVVQFLAVGQGDGAVVQFPDGRVWLVDTGPDPDAVLDVLRREGILHLDRVLLSHPHPDHDGGLAAILDQLHVDTLVVPRAPRLEPVRGQPPESEVDYLQLLQTAARVGTRVAFAQVPAPATLLHPWLGWQSPARDPVNDESLVFRLDFGARRFLFTGDVEAAGEAELLAHHADALAADVLKVPHHGSRTSSSPAFVAAVNPTIAVISCGEQNRFHHPSPETLEHYAGRRVYRTDRDGSVIVTTDGESLEVDLPDVAPVFARSQRIDGG